MAYLNIGQKIETWILEIIVKYKYLEVEMELWILALCVKLMRRKTSAS